MKILSLIYRYLAVAALLAVTAACADDLRVPGQEEGVPVSLKVNISLPDMSAMSRSDMIDGLDYRVESLWVGVYNVASGKRTGYATPTPANNITQHNPQKIELDAETGSSYIVAVANYQGRQVIDSEGNTVDFATALANADTWEKFVGISTMFDADGNINPDVPVNAVLMSGHYLSSHANGDYASIEPVSIPDTGILNGAIHLRRLISQVKFNVTYNTANISDFEIVNWTVHNLPNQSWVAETYRGTPNVGDIRTVGTAASYQNTHPTNISSVVNGADGTKSWQFDWWQLENKRTGLDHVTTYNDREAEFKNDADKTNTGLYKSLVPTAASTDDPNNNATFVEINVRMSMKVDQDGKTLPDGNVRIVDGVYTVHLGYCEGNDPDKSRDFNCRRNTKYTYNVTVNNVKDIYVEAHSDKQQEIENAPGAEGMISDVTGKFVELDAHYGVYNIYLSSTELETFEYMIRCYDGNGAEVDIDSKEPSTVPAAGDSRRKYLEWVEIRPTTSATLLSEYKPRTGANNDGKTYTLDEFKAGITTGTVTEGYYTVFFNEYVYETATDGNEDNSTAWKEYVNKPDRQVWIRVQEAKSPDGESTHFTSKYAFSQKSIQTYYDVNSDATAAIGVEHVNESLGLNLRSIWQYGTSADNGRYNTAAYIANGNNSWTQNNWREATYLWENYVVQTTPQTVNEINTQGIRQEAYGLNNPLPLPALIGLQNQSKHDYDPDQSTSAKFIEAANACMNRNRDLNGNGRIDINEIRWYIPTSNVYIRMILGRRSLSTPIMDYENRDQLIYTNTSLDAPVHGKAQLNGLITSLLLYGNNNGNNGSNILWAMEGTSTSRWGEYNYGAWNVRCIRNLSTDLSGLTSVGKVPAAYRKRPNATNTIEMVFYDPQSVRQEKLTTIPPHDIANQDYNRCYKAFEYSAVQTTSRLSGYATYYNDWVGWLTNGNPCANLGSGWRIPNQKEISIMNTLRDEVTINAFLPSATFSHYKLTNGATDHTADGGALKNISDLNINEYPTMCITQYRYGTQQHYANIRGSMQVRCVRDVD